MEAANLLNFHPLGRSKSYHEGFIQIFLYWLACIELEIIMLLYD